MASDDSDALLRALAARALATASTRRERQLAALVAAALDGDHDRVGALAREHVVDHPDDVLAAWLASLSSALPSSAPPHQEKP